VAIPWIFFCSNVYNRFGHPDSDLNGQTFILPRLRVPETICKENYASPLISYVDLAAQTLTSPPRPLTSPPRPLDLAAQTPTSPPRPVPPPTPLWLSGQLPPTQRGRGSGRGSGPVRGSGHQGGPPRGGASGGNRGANTGQWRPPRGGQYGRWGRW
jgi:hypothetical protein